MSTPAPTAHADDNQLITERREKLAVLRAQAKAAGTAVFPNDFKPTHRAGEARPFGGGRLRHRRLAH